MAAPRVATAGGGIDRPNHLSPDWGMVQVAVSGVDSVPNPVATDCLKAPTGDGDVVDPVPLAR
eukprot:8681365-Lingulodinium_polyedra.AAC.1